MNTWVQYFPGDCGTFVSWFISQHQGYIGAKASLKVHDPVPNEVVSDSTTWDWRAETWDQQKQTRIENWAGEDVAFKTYTEHNCTNTDKHPDWEMQQFWDRVQTVPRLNSVALWVLPEHLHRFESRLSHCFESYAEGASAETYYSNRSGEYQELERVHSEHLSTIDLHWTNVYSLIFEQDLQEYQRLIEFLSTEPIEHWRTIMSFYQLQVFDSLR